MSVAPEPTTVPGNPWVVPTWQNRTSDASHLYNGRTKTSVITISREGTTTQYGFCCGCCPTYQALADKVKMERRVVGSNESEVWHGQGDPSGRWCLGCCVGSPATEYVMENGDKTITYSTLAEQLKRAWFGPNIVTGEMHNCIYAGCCGVPCLVVCDCFYTGNYWWTLCCEPGFCMEMKSYLGSKSDPNMRMPIGGIYTASPLAQTCCSDSIILAYVTQGVEGKDKVQYAAIRAPVKSCAEQCCVGPCMMIPIFKCCFSPTACCIPGCCKNPGGCCACPSVNCTSSSSKPKEPDPEMTCCKYVMGCHCCPAVACCAPGCACCSPDTKMCCNTCASSCCSNKYVSMCCCPACIYNPWCCDPCGTYEVTRPSGNTMYWATPAGEKYLQIAEVDHTIVGHNCCPCQYTKDVELKVQHWDDDENEANMMSIIPMWELFNTFKPDDRARLKHCQTKTEAMYDPLGHLVFPKMRADMQSKAQARRNRIATGQPLPGDTPKDAWLVPGLTPVGQNPI